MPFTNFQKIRKLRSMNRNNNERLAGMLRNLSKMLQEQGGLEFSTPKVMFLQQTRTAISRRLYINETTKMAQRALDGKIPKVDGEFVMNLDQKNL